MQRSKVGASNDVVTRLTKAGQGTFPYSVASILLVFAAWHWATSTGQLPPIFLPSIKEVLAAFYTVWTEGYAGATLPVDIMTSLGRLALGFGGAILIGVPLGLAIATDRRIREAFDPWIQFYRSLPPLAYLGLMILWFGTGDTSKIFLLMLSALPPVVIATAAAVESVRIERVQGARSVGLRGFSLFRYVILPSCLPDIVTACRVGFAVAYTTLIAAEMINADSGLGAMIFEASNHLATAVVIVGIVVMGATGVVIDGIMRMIQRRLVPWAGRA